MIIIKYWLKDPDRALYVQFIILLKPDYFTWSFKFLRTLLK